MKIQRVPSLIVAMASSAVMAGMCIWALSGEPTRLAAAIVALGGLVASQLLLYKTLGAHIEVNPSHMVLVGQIRTRQLLWSDVSSLELSGWFGGPAIIVVTKGGRRYLVPPIMRRQRVADLEELRAAILKAAKRGDASV